MLVSPVQVAQSAAFTLNMVDYGFPSAQSMVFSVSQVNADGSRTVLGSFANGVYAASETIAARGVLVLEVTIAG